MHYIFLNFYNHKTAIVFTGIIITITIIINNNINKNNKNFYYKAEILPNILV